MCLANSTSPCNPQSLPALISCLDAQCSTNSALAKFALTYSPKLEYPCEQSQVPNGDGRSPRLTITGLGHCSTSPYDFQSFLSDSGNDTTMAQLCRMKVYPQSDCAGKAEVLKLDWPYEKCTFQSGRSARLDCSAAHDDSAAIRYAQDICGNLTDFASKSSTSHATASSTGGLTSSITGSVGGNHTGSVSNTTAPSALQGIANSNSDASVAALLALVATIALL